MLFRTSRMARKHRPSNMIYETRLRWLSIKSSLR